MSILGPYRTQIRQGDSCVWIARPNTLDNGAPIDSNWRCYTGVFSSEGAVGVPIKEVTEKIEHESNEYFLVVITPAETVQLAAGTWEFVIDISNETVSPPYRDEQPITLKVDEQRIPDQTP